MLEFDDPHSQTQSVPHYATMRNKNTSYNIMILSIHSTFTKSAVRSECVEFPRPRLTENVCRLQIMRSSAGNVKRTPAEIADDPEEEDEYGYTNSEYKSPFSSFISLALREMRPDIYVVGCSDVTRVAKYARLHSLE